MKILQFLLAGAIIASSECRAEFLAPGASAAVTPTSLQLDPSLAGLVITQKTVPFSSYLITSLVLSAEFRTTVVRETAAGTLDFYYEIGNPNPSFIDPPSRLTVTDFDDTVLSVHYLVGSSNFAPGTATRSEDGNSVSFFNFPSGEDLVFPPNSVSATILVQTNATEFSSHVLATIEFNGVYSGPLPNVHSIGTAATFAPAPVPEPSWALCLALANMHLLLRRSPRRR